jgi:hypothetical protein
MLPSAQALAWTALYMSAVSIFQDAVLGEKKVDDEKR